MDWILLPVWWMSWIPFITICKQFQISPSSSHNFCTHHKLWDDTSQFSMNWLTHPSFPQHSSNLDPYLVALFLSVLIGFGNDTDIHVCTQTMRSHLIFCGCTKATKPATRFKAASNVFFLLAMKRSMAGGSLGAVKWKAVVKTARVVILPLSGLPSVFSAYHGCLLRSNLHRINWCTHQYSFGKFVHFESLIIF